MPIATIEGMAERTVTINSLSKTYSVTGWRVGWTISPPSLTGAIRKVHDFLTVGAAAPLQEAGVAALGVPEQLLRGPGGRRTSGGATCCSTSSSGITSPATSRYGAYYIMTDISALRLSEDDVEFARYLVKDVGVAAVPGSSFYRNAAAGRTKLRFCFCKKDETLIEADRRLAKLSVQSGRSVAPEYHLRLCDSECRRQYLATTPKYSPFSSERPGVVGPSSSVTVTPTSNER